MLNSSTAYFEKESKVFSLPSNSFSIIKTSNRKYIGLHEKLHVLQNTLNETVLSALRLSSSVF